MFKIKVLILSISLFILFTIVMSEDLLIEDLKIPQRIMGEFCGYQSCQRVKENVLNIHIIPSTLYELGYTKHFEEYYSGIDATNLYLKSEINMKKTLDSVVSELWADNTRRFVFSDLPYFFRWWKERDGTIKRMVYELVRQGRLVFVGGGWGLIDESTAGYQSILDSFTYGLRKLNETFGECGRPLVAWQVDSFGHSREMANLLSGLGYDAVFINPISYDDELNRMEKKSLEIIWRGSDDIGHRSDIFTHKLFDGYWSPPGMCFDNYCKDDNILDSDSTMTNVQDKVKEFIKATVHRQAPHYRTKNILIVLGARYAYYDARKWFRNIDKLITHANNQAINFGANIHTFYSTPACYLRAVYNENPLLPIKQDDFLPVALTDSEYFTGLYSSRPTFKYMIRVANIFFQIAKQLEVIAGLGLHTKELEFIKWTMGVVHDRNILSGAHRPHVADYYKTKLYIATQKATNIMRNAFNKIRGVDPITKYYRCLFNESECMNTNSERSYIIIYNPLGWPVTVNVRLPTSSPEYIITDSYGEFVDATAMPIPEQVLQLPLRRTTANIELVFVANNVPPLGFTSYFIKLKPIVNRRVLKSVTLSENNEKKGSIKIIDEEEEEFNITDNNMVEDSTKFNSFLVSKSVTENYEADDSIEASDEREDNITDNKMEYFSINTLNSTELNDNLVLESVTIAENDEGGDIIKVSEEEKDVINKKYDGDFNFANFSELLKSIKTTTDDKNIVTGEDYKRVIPDFFGFHQDKSPKKTKERNRKVTAVKEIKTDDKRVLPVLLGSHSDVSQNRTEEKSKNNNEGTTEALKVIKKEKFLLPPEEEKRQRNKTKALISKFYFGNNKTVPGKLFRYKHIKNKFLKIELDRDGYKIGKVILSNGEEIFLDIQFCYYEAFVRNKTKDFQISSGPYIFRPKNKNPIPIFERNKPNIFVSNIVKEIHISYADFASIVLRLYNNTSVIEVDWMIGPVPIEDDLGKEIILKYTTDLRNKNTFYTDSNGRQTIKRRVNERPTWNYEQIRQVVGNYYPVNSKIYIEDLQRNIRFSVFNDRSQGGGSINEGEIELMVHRRLLSEETNAYFILNETDGDSGLIVRGKHYIFISEADSNVNKVFEKKLVKEIQLAPQIIVSKSEPNIILRNFLKINNQFSALKVKLPLGIHLLTLEPWTENTMLIRFENYLEKSDIGNKNTKKINLQNLFENLKIVNVKETTLGANMWKEELNPLQWEGEAPFINNFNRYYGSNNDIEFAEEEYTDEGSFQSDWKSGIKVLPMEIKTFIVKYKFQIH